MKINETKQMKCLEQCLGHAMVLAAIMVIISQIRPCSEPNHSYLAHYANTLLSLVRWLRDANARDWGSHSNP